MKNRIVSILASAVLVALATAPAFAALQVGSKAPNFTIQATQAGKVFTFTLADALKKGPVVLYFYPAAFTPGCTIEAHEFADAIETYKSYNATVLGVSHDPLAKLKKFSVSDCRDKFAVAADTGQAVEKAYDAVLPQDAQYANRTSYVIAPDGTVLYTYTNLQPDKHVSNTLDALRTWSKR